ncbi:30S ribosomal protein S16 [Scrofimicrobium sp. R131]|uniref:Small ribosomal subunit protein bS16 n=1 Tax=Scrofimicrobium appendicitidis TaxID=3079930 RepID=A0AAU7V9P9_9ACTO
MAVRIRLKRMGKIHAPFYRVVVVDSRKKRDGRVIEEVGIYNPMPNPSIIEIESERVQHWLKVGAQPSDTVRRLLVLSGDIARFNGKEDAVSRIQVANVDREAEAKEAVEAVQANAQKAKAKAAEEKAKQEVAEEPAAEAEGE